MKTLLFISTNSMWSGSEELWSRSAKRFVEMGHSVAYAVKYNHEQLNEIRAENINYLNRYVPKRFLQRVVEKTGLLKFSQKDLLLRFISQIKPQLIIISQGNNYESLDVINHCVDLCIPYVTLTQLVAEIFVGSFNNENFENAQKMYKSALKNFFVSRNNLDINNFIIGVNLLNAEVVYNPCKLIDSKILDFPKDAIIYQVGLVGRIDCWHKGYDLLIKVLDQEKWKLRAIQFNIYGEGPQSEFIKSQISILGIKNVFLKGHCKEVTSIWESNHILLMPSRIEGQALALIEAMWCRRAAIVTDVGGASELVEEGISGFIAESPTVKDIDSALERAWTRRNEWQQMGINAAIALKDKYPVDAVDHFNNQIFNLLN